MPKIQHRQKSFVAKNLPKTLSKNSLKTQQKSFMNNNFLIEIVKKISNLAKTSQFKVYRLSKRQYEELRIIETMDEPQKSRVRLKYYKSINKNLAK